MGFSTEHDVYVHKAPEFAKPILIAIRLAFHEAVPDIEENIKWGYPHFCFKGIVGQVAAFKNHVRFIFWKGQQMELNDPAFSQVGEKSGMMGLSLTSINDMPDPDTFKKYILEAVELNTNPKKKASAKQIHKRPDLIVPVAFLDALAENQAAFEHFHLFSESAKREYVEWYEEAKQDHTREKRLKQSIEWMSEGKPRNWKYMSTRKNT